MVNVSPCDQTVCDHNDTQPGTMFCIRSKCKWLRIDNFYVASGALFGHMAAGEIIKQKPYKHSVTTHAKATHTEQYESCKSTNLKSQAKIWKDQVNHHINHILFHSANNNNNSHPNHHHITHKTTSLQDEYSTIHHHHNQYHHQNKHSKLKKKQNRNTKNHRIHTIRKANSS